MNLNDYSEKQLKEMSFVTRDGRIAQFSKKTNNKNDSYPFHFNIKNPLTGIGTNATYEENGYFSTNNSSHPSNLIINGKS